MKTFSLISVFSPNTGNYGPEKHCLWTLFKQCNRENSALNIVCPKCVTVQNRNFFIESDGKKRSLTSLLPSDADWIPSEILYIYFNN